ncbi:MAG: Asp-tRNA(Asn)/Glu-tRNA(Gln) amidotransferase A subunit family amidase [Gammaproteobacteria bacterium]|jgi:Asp-tRNA(Asn)/Glu-tRNA(Gln) amidotransferase A subunit family amidase
MSTPNQLSATQAAAKIASGELSAVELMQACLARIAEREADVQAWVFLDTERAMNLAREADALLASGKGIGALHGVPIGIKDIIDTADMPTENGSPMFKGRTTNHDAACVSALRDAGAIILGKTVTTELANSFPGKTHNPHNLEYSPGGSSSGSAAGVADFHMPLALGTQTGGSVIRPGSFCGIYALKPTLGLISRSGVLLQSPTLDTVGVYGRSVEDLGLITDCLSARDPSDPVNYPRSRSNLLATLREQPSSTPRLAFLRTPGWPSASEAAQQALLKYVEQLGDRCVEESLPAPFDQICELHRHIMGPEDLTYYGDFLRDTPELLSAHLREKLIANKSVTASEYVNAQRAREIINADFNALLGRYDAVLCLSSAHCAPHGLGSTGDAIFNGLWTYLGVPCVSLPKLEVDGMPMGVQLVGMRGDEGRLLRTARWLDGYL